MTQDRNNLTFGIAHNLVGFSQSSLRVKITEIRDGRVWCVTSDLSDAGCPLVLDQSQVEILERAERHENESDFASMYEVESYYDANGYCHIVSR